MDTMFDQRAQQSEVNALLARALVFSFIWLPGLGSLYSIILARQAHRIIKAPNGRLDGMVRVWWCYLFGGFCIILMLSVVVTVSLNK
jgi:hypothetical protein